MVVQFDRLVADPDVHLINEISFFPELFEIDKVFGMLELSNEGNGSGVVVVHGFLSFDQSTGLLRDYLSHQGYEVFRSGIGLNAVCLSEALSTLIESCEKARSETNNKIVGIGHSLGGLLIRGAATMRPDLFEQVIVMGSPINSIKVTPMVARAHGLVAEILAALSGCGYGPDCSCGVVEVFRTPFPETVDHHSIYTEADGVVNWHCCLEEDDQRNHKVLGSHSGLPGNMRVVRLVRTLIREHLAIA